MFFCYTIADRLFSEAFEGNYELNYEKLRNIVHLIRKNSSFVDCNYDGRYESISEDWRDLYDNCEDQDLQILLKIIWIDGIFKNRLISRKSICDDCDSCSLDKNIEEIKRTFSDFPKFVLAGTEDENRYEKITTVSGVQGEFFQNNFDKTCYEEELLLDFNSGKELIKKNWSSLISLLNDKIIIMDQIVFGNWRENYQKGLIQFVEVISEFNPELELEIVTKLSPHDSGKSKHDIKKEIQETIDTLKPIKIKFTLSSSEKFDHDRFIIFDNLVGAELSRGLDTFYAASRTGEAKIKNYRIIYYDLQNEVDNYLAVALRDRVIDSEFQNIKNY